MQKVKEVAHKMGIGHTDERGVEHNLQSDQQNYAGHSSNQVLHGEQGVIGTEHFTKTEDRPVVKERTELIQEHRPVEKEFVVETRATGEERQVAGGNVEHLGTTEREVNLKNPVGTGHHSTGRTL